MDINLELSDVVGGQDGQDDEPSVERPDAQEQPEPTLEDVPAAPPGDPNARNVLVHVLARVLYSRPGQIIWVTEQQAHDYRFSVTRVHRAPA